MEIKINILGLFEAVVDILMQAQLVLLVLQFTKLIHYTWWQLGMPLLIVLGIDIAATMIAIIANMMFEEGE